MKTSLPSTSGVWVVGQQFTAVGRHFIGNERVVNDIRQDLIRILTGNIQRAGMLRVLAPLRSRGRALRKGYGGNQLERLECDHQQAKESRGQKTDFHGLSSGSSDATPHAFPGLRASYGPSE
jgi:hypothetical protein